MNPKLFALLLLIPVAVFATDRLISKDAPDGGVKEKKKPTTEATTTQGTEIQANAPEETNTSAQALQSTARKQPEPPFETVSPGDLTRDYTADVKAGLERMDEALYDVRDQDQVVWLGSDRLDEKVSNWLEKAVSQPVKAANPLKIDVRDSFSRCPSGYHILITVEEGKTPTDGWIVGDEGCHDRGLGHFVFDYASRSVQVHVGPDGELLPLPLYLKYCKAALS